MDEDVGDELYVCRMQEQLHMTPAASHSGNPSPVSHSSSVSPEYRRTSPTSSVEHPYQASAELCEQHSSSGHDSQPGTSWDQTENAHRCADISGSPQLNHSVNLLRQQQPYQTPNITRSLPLYSEKYVDNSRQQMPVSEPIIHYADSPSEYIGKSVHEIHNFQQPSLSEEYSDHQQLAEASSSNVLDCVYPTQPANHSVHVQNSRPDSENSERILDDPRQTILTDDKSIDRGKPNEQDDQVIGRFYGRYVEDCTGQQKIFVNYVEDHDGDTEESRFTKEAQRPPVTELVRQMEYFGGTMGVCGHPAPSSIFSEDYGPLMAMPRKELVVREDQLVLGRDEIEEMMQQVVFVGSEPQVLQNECTEYPTEDLRYKPESPQVGKPEVTMYQCNIPRFQLEGTGYHRYQLEDLKYQLRSPGSELEGLQSEQNSPRYQTGGSYQSEESCTYPGSMNLYGPPSGEGFINTSREEENKKVDFEHQSGESHLPNMLYNKWKSVSPTKHKRSESEDRWQRMMEETGRKLAADNSFTENWSHHMETAHRTLREWQEQMMKFEEQLEQALQKRDDFGAKVDEFSKMMDVYYVKKRSEEFRRYLVQYVAAFGRPVHLQRFERCRECKSSSPRRFIELWHGYSRFENGWLVATVNDYYEDRGDDDVRYTKNRRHSF